MLNSGVPVRSGRISQSAYRDEAQSPVDCDTRTTVSGVRIGMTRRKRSLRGYITGTGRASLQTNMSGLKSLLSQAGIFLFSLSLPLLNRHPG